jgi:hypothetical protein
LAISRERWREEKGRGAMGGEARKTDKNKIQVENKKKMM